MTGRTGVTILHIFGLGMKGQVLTRVITIVNFLLHNETEFEQTLPKKVPVQEARVPYPNIQAVWAWNQQ